LIKSEENVEIIAKNSFIVDKNKNDKNGESKFGCCG
jgi:hypothetical protein